jgi:hypothetical protein
MGAYDLNEEAIVIREPFLGSNLYYIDDFYKNPDAIVDILNKTPSYLHHPDPSITHGSLNGIYFEDRRHKFECEEVLKVYDHLSSICGRAYHPQNKRLVITNQSKFFKNDFNNFKDNYWYPHCDIGYNGLVYLNKCDNTCGTNLYRNIHREEATAEHIDPWRPKRNWELLTTLKPTYNRCILFDGVKFPHGMHIPNDRYFGEEYRLNQVFFFVDEQA